ncbi:hypothetical protein FRX31_019918 [Thalictrum thalictroides]|uniref:Ubiquitin-like protease family profile domain-containing protein n=1 Tax=Thalictrum thalictroides TaxID=46969 RepID=A0A7J6W2H0_THATH|nr:hypothetical protein FRX31_019918 [Thalictrum thalictroides]
MHGFSIRGITSQFMVNEGKRAKSITWHYPKCPKQVGDFECGYFVMLFMRHFMSDPYKSLKAKITELESKATYTKAELNEVRVAGLVYRLANILPY